MIHFSLVFPNITEWTKHNLFFLLFCFFLNRQHSAVFMHNTVMLPMNTSFFYWNQFREVHFCRISDCPNIIHHCVAGSSPILAHLLEEVPFTAPKTAKPPHLAFIIDHPPDHEQTFCSWPTELIISPIWRLWCSWIVHVTLLVLKRTHTGRCVPELCVQIRM